MRVQVWAHEKSFLAETSLISERSVLKCFQYTLSAHVVMSYVPVIRYRLERCDREVYKLLSSLESRYGPEKFRRRLKLV